MKDVPVPAWPPIPSAAASIERELGATANAERIEVMSGGYAPSGLRYLGSSVPDIRRVVTRWSATFTSAPPNVIRDLALLLVRRRTIEGRQVGYELMAKRRDVMALVTPALIKKLAHGNDNWASVDGFASFISGPAWQRGRVSDADVMRWARSSDRWWRRTALASAVMLNRKKYGSAGDAPRTLRICQEFAAEKDPMLAKALSWALRSATPCDPKAVRAFLAKHESTLPAIVRREVGTKLRTGKKN